MASSRPSRAGHHPSKAHSVEIIDRRLQQAEVDGRPDAMELLSIHDELSRVERKWREKASADMKTDRPLANAAMINARFERVARLIAAAIHRAEADPDNAGPDMAMILPLLRKSGAALQARAPLPEQA